MTPKNLKEMYPEYAKDRNIGKFNGRGHGLYGSSRKEHLGNFKKIISAFFFYDVWIHVMLYVRIFGNKIIFRHRDQISISDLLLTKCLLDINQAYTSI